MNALVAAGADMQANRRRRSDASARRGAYQGHAEAMKVLAALGADRRAKAADGAEPLHDAGRTTERVEAGRMPMALPERGLSRGTTVNPRFKTLLWSRIGCVALVGGQQPLQRRVGTPHALHGGAAPSAGLPERVAPPSLRCLPALLRGAPAMSLRVSATTTYTFRPRLRSRDKGGPSAHRVRTALSPSHLLHARMGLCAGPTVGVCRYLHQTPCGRIARGGGGRGAATHTRTSR